MVQSGHYPKTPTTLIRNVKTVHLYVLNPNGHYIQGHSGTTTATVCFNTYVHYIQGQWHHYVPKDNDRLYINIQYKLSLYLGT